MSEPAPVGVDHAPGFGKHGRGLARFASLGFLLEVALALRIMAAGAVEWYVRRGGSDRLCLFPDTWNYWELARTIRMGAPYEVLWWGDIPHAALRTPGYPLFLACCQTLFGERTLPIRLAQAALGTLGVYLVYRLTSTLCEGQQVRAGTDPGFGDGDAAPAFLPQAARGSRRRWTVPLVAAGLAAIHPLDLFMSALILSEAVFQPLLIAALWGLSELWTNRSTDAEFAATSTVGRSVAAMGRYKAAMVAVGSGIATGAAILARPSWALFVPAILTIWVISKLARGHGGFTALERTLYCALGIAVVMGPWWARNARVYGRFVPTALWLGASLYDGLNPQATGASDMSFLSDPEIWPRDEQDQDAELIRRAWDFSREHPGRVLGLAVVKFCRYWSPWPNAAGFRTPAVSAAITLFEAPLLGLMAVGAWTFRRELRIWVLFAGPILYFCALHLVFASSMRYRIPGEIAALGLAALGWSRITARRRAAGSS
jgi:hypothetical protein